MSSILFFLQIAFVAIICIHFLFPLLLRLLKYRKNDHGNIKNSSQSDYAIIVTYYKQINLLPGLLTSINGLNYENFIVYVVADNCERLDFKIEDPRIIFLEPSQILKDNVKSHRFAIRNFIRDHDRVTIIDGDNLLHQDYLLELNKMFDKGYSAVQGARSAKNLNNDYANVDAIGDLYYRYVDRKLLFEAGSSAALSGSGMAFKTSLFVDCLKDYNGKGAGFDKILQYQIIRRGIRIAFSNEVIVYDQKTTSSEQLIKQRARWINTWFKTINIGSHLFLHSVFGWNRNAFLFSMILLRPPLFILFTLLFISFLVNIFFYPILNIVLLGCVLTFFFVFFEALRSFKAPKSMYNSLISIPKFIFFQFLALFKIRVADQISTATQHSIIENEQKR